MGELDTSYIIGVDVGGTFTDCCVLGKNGVEAAGKSLSTPADYSEGVIQSLTVALGPRLKDVLKKSTLFCHGTTVAENALLTGKWSRSGMITTRGFEDTLFIMRGRAEFSLSGQTALTSPIRRRKAPPLISRADIHGVSERIDHKGRVVVPLMSKDANTALKRVVDEKIESIGICLLWSFVNPEHERKIKKLLDTRYPGVMVTLSSDVAPQIGEYERMSTTALNACLAPVASRHLLKLQRKLTDNGLRCGVQIVEGHGGAIPIQKAVANPVGAVESGPAAGVTAASQLGNLMGIQNIIAADMGGTTFKVSVIIDGGIRYATDPTILGYSMLTPKIDILSIGAGGGSIAWIEDITGLLKVGPLSAGSKPGPICYGLGGNKPTVTDADLLLGYLDEEYFLGGKMKLRRDVASQAMRSQIAKPLKINEAEAAYGVFMITTAQMSDLIRNLTVERGRNPRDFVLFAYGGAGPVHCSALAQELEIGKVIIPAMASVQGAFGAATSDVVHEYGRTDFLAIPADVQRVNDNFKEIVHRAIEDLKSEGFSHNAIKIAKSLEIRYKRQVHQLLVPVPEKDVLTADDLRKVYRRFAALYDEAYGKGSAYEEAGTEIVNFRVRATGKLEKSSFSKVKLGGKDSSHALRRPRRVYFGPKDGWVSTDIFTWDDLDPGNQILGPAIVETSITTIVVRQGQRGMLDAFRNFVITLDGDRQ